MRGVFFVFVDVQSIKPLIVLTCIVTKAPPFQSRGTESGSTNILRTRHSYIDISTVRISEDQE